MVYDQRRPQRSAKRITFALLRVKLDTTNSEQRLADLDVIQKILDHIRGSPRSQSPPINPTVTTNHN